MLMMMKLYSVFCDIRVELQLLLSSEVEGRG